MGVCRGSTYNRSLGAKQGGATSRSPDGFIQALRGDKVALGGASRSEFSKTVQHHSACIGSRRVLVQHSQGGALRAHRGSVRRCSLRRPPRWADGIVRPGALERRIDRRRVSRDYRRPASASKDLAQPFHPVARPSAQVRYCSPSSFTRSEYWMCLDITTLRTTGAPPGSSSAGDAAADPRTRAIQHHPSRSRRTGVGARHARQDRSRRDAGGHVAGGCHQG